MSTVGQVLFSFFEDHLKVNGTYFVAHSWP